MKIAIIDLGTNTFNLLIASPEHSSFAIEYKTKLPVKLGEGGINEGRIAPEPFKRGTEAMRQFSQMAESHKCDRVYALATAAIREATNGEEFVDAVRRKTGIYVDVIDGDREAELIYRGVRHAVPLEGTALIMDIGGGSTEFILADREQVYWKQSFPLGVTRLFEKFNPKDPITAEDLAALEEHLKDTLSPLRDALQNHQPELLIGASGSFTTFAQLQAQHFPEDVIDVQAPACPLNPAHFETVTEHLLRSTLQERLADPAIPDFRAASIHLSAYLAGFVFTAARLKRMVRSSYAMKEGMIAELVERDQIS